MRYALVATGICSVCEEPATKRHTFDTEEERDAYTPDFRHAFCAVSDHTDGSQA